MTFKNPFLFVLMLLISLSVYAKSANKAKVSKKHRSIILGIGLRTLNTDTGTILTEYLYESPSIDIDTANPNVSYNEGKLTNLPYDIAGLRLTVGVAYTWTK